MAPVAGLALLLLAQVGYVGWLARRASVGPALAPAGAVAGQLVLAFGCGLAGALWLAPWLIVGAGLVLLLSEAARAPRALGATLCHPAIVMLMLATGALVAVLRGARFVHYDNFSHWALVVRLMLRDDAFPDATTVAQFHSYPLGTASWEYAVAALTGPADWHLMVANGYLLVACAVTAFAVTVRRWWCGIVGALALIVALGAHGPHLDTLLVDSVLAAFTIAGLAVVAARRTDIVRAAPLLAVFAAALVATKQTGVLWALVIAGAALTLGAGRVRGRLVAFLATLGGAAASAWVWRRHTASTFGADPGSKHSVSRERFEQILEQKSPEVRAEISRLYAEATARDWPTYALLGVLALVLVLLAARRPALRDRAARAFALAVVLVIVIVIGQYLMYLLSMPTNEALHLAGYERYVSTVHQVLLGAVVLAAGRLTERPAGTWVPAAWAAQVGSVACLIPLTSPTPPPAGAAVPARMAAAIEAAQVPAGAHVCFYTDVRDGGYRTHILRYLLLSDAVSPRLAPPRLTSAIPPSCDYAMVLDAYPRARAYLREHGFAAPNDGTPVVVSVRSR